MICSSKQINQIDVRERGVAGARPALAAASLLALTFHLAAGCSRGGYTGGGIDASVRDAQGTGQDASMPDLATSDLVGWADLPSPADFAAPPDLVARNDFAAPPDMTAGTITGGPCMSGGSGATAFRVRWRDGGGRASVDYEVHGLPDKSRWKVGTYGYSFGFVPQFVDPFLGSGGLLLDSSDFIDVEISTLGIHRIASITLAIFGRSYSTGSSGSFNWMTFTGSGSTPLNYVSNVAPYRWYPADATSDVAPDDGGILIRIKAGGSSGALVVNRLELCIDGS